MKKVIVLNFNNGEVHVFNAMSDFDEDEFFEDDEIKEIIPSMDDCHWMVVDELSINVH